MLILHGICEFASLARKVQHGKPREERSDDEHPVNSTSRGSRNVARDRQYPPEKKNIEEESGRFGSVGSPSAGEFPSGGGTQEAATRAAREAVGSAFVPLVETKTVEDVSSDKCGRRYSE